MAKRNRRSTKIDESDNFNDPFSVLPLDVMVEILLKLPAMSIARLNFVSKHWSSIISNKDFTKLYMTRSLTRPRLLFFYNKKLILESCSQKNPSFDHQRVNIACQPDGCMHAYDFSAPIHGLICHYNGTRMMVGNPSTGQFLTLPIVKIREGRLFSCFGYDPVNDLYKVLCITVYKVFYEHQVFTLGPSQKWRKIACKHPHLPLSVSKCINGVVYYYAWIKKKGTLICFDLTSEDFSVVKLPEDIECLVNYGGKIALCSQMYNATLNLWVLKDVKTQEWSKVSHLVPSWTDLVGTSTMRFKGTLSTGQLVFAPLIYNSYYPYFLISYDLNENTAKKVMIEGIGNNSEYFSCYLDHVESPILLSNVS